MVRALKVPDGARLLRTYAEFESYLADFVQHKYTFLWVVGRPGISKSESVHAAVRGHSVYYRPGGQLTPAQFYIDCYCHRGQPIILDDAEHLLESRIGEKLISALGDTSPAKQLSYGTTSSILGDVPDVYSTTSSLCIIANRQTPYEHIRSRAVTLYFDPSNREIHQAAARWFWDQEIHDWVGQHLSRLPPLDTRWYVIAYHDKQARRDWRNIILTTHVPSRAACVVQDLEVDATYPTRDDKARRFEEVIGNCRGASRATYFRLRGRLEDEDRLLIGVCPSIPLRHTRPPGIPSELELDSTATPPAELDEEPRVLDVPARDEFAQPIRGDVTADATVRPVRMDDTVPWENSQGQDEGPEQ